MTIVFGFDRDWTVDVNPHPNRTAVPLEWVRYLAHETNHPVYAIGNQRLAEEAAIPGVVDVVGRHDDDWATWLGGKQPDGRYERYPTRRERLALIADLHPDADAYVVVDDLDLGDVDDWSHYHAWDFVPALERGAFDPALPWVEAEATSHVGDDVRTDGGTGRIAAWGNDDDADDNADDDVDDDADEKADENANENADDDFDVDADEKADDDVDDDANEDGDADSLARAFGAGDGDERLRAPSSASDLAAFLDDHADATGFELASHDDDSRRSRLVHDVSVLERTVERPAAAEAVRCVPVDPREDAFTVRVDSIRRLAVVDPPAGAFTPDDASKRERIRGLRRLAASAPARVPATMTIVYLDTAIRREPRRDLLLAICRGTAENPVAFVSAVPTLRAELDIDDPIAPAATLRALRRIASASPADVAPASDVALAFLAADHANATEGVRREAAMLASELVDAHADDVEPFRDDLGAVVRERAPGLAHATYALTALGRDDPRVLDPVRDVLVDVVRDDETPDDVRSNALAALGRLVGEDPALGVDVVPAAVELVSADDAKLRNNAVALVADVATHHGDVVAEHVDALTALLDVDDEFARINATGALARVAEDAPRAVAAVTPLLRARLADDDAVVRRNACDFLGHASGSHGGGYEGTDVAAVPALERLATEDPDADVRRHAVLALDRIDDGSVDDEDGTADDCVVADEEGSR